MVNSRRFCEGSCATGCATASRISSATRSDMLLATWAAITAIPARTSIAPFTAIAARRRAGGGAFAFTAVAGRWGTAFFGRDQRLARQADLAGRIDVDHLDQHLLAFLELVAHVLDAVVRDLRDVQQARSEEHTSELQSQSNLVCRLLLEKKKQN